MKKEDNGTAVRATNRVRRLWHVALCLCVGGSCTRFALADRIAGVVFLDANRNGQRDPSERGIGGVPVTDSLSFAVTDKNGRYEIDAKLDRLCAKGDRPIVSVTIPEGYWPTKGWFRRIGNVQDPNGVSFGLREDKQSVPFAFVHGTDPHVPRGGTHLFPLFRSEMRRLANRVKLCVITGDLAHMPDLEPQAKGLRDYRIFAAGIKNFPIPLFCTPGNHDMTGYRAKGTWDTRHRLYGYGAYTHYVGPLRWSFNYAGHHFVGVDWLDREGGKWIRRIPHHAKGWIEQDAALAPKGVPVLLFVHYPTWSAEIGAVLKRYPLKYIFAGHTHEDRTTVVDGVPAVQSVSLGQTHLTDRRPGYRLVWIDDGRVETFYKASGDPHAVTLDFPRMGDALHEQAIIRGGFFDSEGQIERLIVRIGSAGGETAFRRTSMFCRFDARLDLRSEPAGFRPLEVVIRSGGRTWRMSRNCLVLSGCETPFKAQNDAELLFDVIGIDRGADVLLNGGRLKPLPPTKVRGDGPYRRLARIKGYETMVVRVPAHHLKRLNTVELRSVEKPDGKPDIFCVCDARIRYDGREFRDTRLLYGNLQGRSVKDSFRYCIDLTPGR